MTRPTNRARVDKDWGTAEVLTPPRLHFRVSPEPSRLLRARERIRDYLQQHRFARPVIDDMVLCIEEAATNAIRHSGSAEDLDIRIGMHDGNLSAKVSDRGRGFDVASFDPHQLPDLMSDHGRGLFLISNLTDEMQLVSDNGVTVRMVKKGVEPPGWQSAGPVAAVDTTAQTEYWMARQYSLAEEMGEAFATLDWEYRITYGNTAALRLFSRSLEEVAGQLIWDLFTIEDMPVGRSIRRAMELGLSSIEEYVSPSMGHWLECRIYPTSSGVSLYLRDIDARKRKELERDQLLVALAESQEDLSRAQAVAKTGSWRLDVRQDVLRWSDETYRMFGVAPGTPLTYETFLDRVHPDDRAAVDERWTAALEGAPYEIDHRILVDGQLKWVRERAELEFDGQDRLVGGFGTVADITERKASEEETSRLNAGLAGVNSILELGLRCESEEDLGRACLQVVEHVTGSRFGFIGEIGDDGMLHDIAISDPGWDECRIDGQSGRRRCLGGFPLQGLYGRVLTEGKSLLTNMPAGHPDSAGAPAGHPVVTAFLGVPLKRAGHTFGMVALANREGGYQERERDLVEALAPVIVQVFERKRSEAALRGSEQKYRAVVETAAEGIVLAQPDGTFSYVNQQMAEMLGYPVEEIVGRSGLDFVFEDWKATIPVTREELRRRTVLHGEFKFRRKDGSALWTLYNATVLLDESGEYVANLAMHTDVTDRHFAEVERQRLIEEVQAQNEELQAQGEELQTQGEELQAQNEELLVQHEELKAYADDLEHRNVLGEALNRINALVHSTLQFDEVMQRGLDEGVRVLGADAGTIEMREGRGWVVRYVSGFATDDVGMFLSEAEAPNAMLAAREGRPVAIADMRGAVSDVGFVAKYRLRSVLAVPLVVHGEINGCLLFYGGQPRNFDKTEIDFAGKLGATASLALENARLFEAERANATINEALTRIDSSIHATLDRNDVLRRVAEESAQAIGADSTVLALCQHGLWVVRYAYNMPDDLVGQSFTVDQAPFLAIAAHSQRPVAIDDAFNDPRTRRETQEALRVRAVMMTPLIVGSETIGGLFFNYCDIHTFTPPELGYAARLGTSVGLALRNIDSYETERHIASTLQETFVHPLPQIRGLELAALSLPANQPELVGGDFHDVMELPSGLVLALIGDVMGKGVKAAGLTETVRSAVRALALSSPVPEYILRQVNLMLDRDGHEQFVSAQLVLMDPENGRGFIASAGHPPAVHLSDRGARPLVKARGPLLGLYEGRFTAEEFVLAPHDSLLLYTDGLTEARRNGELFSERRLLELLEDVHGCAPDGLIDCLRRGVLAFAGELKDDLQLLAIRRTS